MTDDQQAWLDECPVGDARTVYRKVDGVGESSRTVDRRVVFSAGCAPSYLPAKPIVIGRSVAPLTVGPASDPLPGTVMCGAPPNWRA